jgi:hypothetical protein
VSADIVSADDQPVTSRRRKRVECPTCHRRMRENSIPRHRERWHPEVPIAALEVEGKVSVRPRFSLRIGARCPRCGGVIPAGSTGENLLDDRDGGARRPKWTHVVCPIAASGAPPPNPRENEDPLTLALTGSGGDPTTPTPSPRVGDSPIPPTTAGDALVPLDKLADLGIRAISSDGRVIRIELAAPNAKDVATRLFGGDMVPCRTCAALGHPTSMPRSYLQRHDLEAHSDLWRRGRLMAELAAIEEGKKARAARELPGRP